MKNAKTAIVAGAIALLGLGSPALAASPATHDDSVRITAACGTTYPAKGYLDYKNCGKFSVKIRPKNKRTGEWHGQCRYVPAGNTQRWWVPLPETDWDGAYYFGTDCA